ncbi:MAG: NAD(P)-dependent alcohol dehydrogenase [Hamadaea sp.]|uniref:NAD(P)-dependent alcohol dehydrogenase n=1 Tax=Hamadaea sp. TaxID=2024425 RepID=UPI00183E093D|nr:NAD(P)-dependent alcohol dehydrogenase [Hamadaea sp.]NUR70947.1 NAD(P)-dependent alcohol dehydrogenase [Hamadaea sp.]NUT21734.1 NAD(P)-dependent alcohol dehydrogenase [Hamadaea sp.]
MRALQLVSPGKIEVRDVEVPEIASDEVLVKVAGAGLCHSDLHVLHVPEWPIPNMTLGHETAGHIEKLGDTVTGFAKGDAVLVYLIWACGVCRPCIEGRDNVCVNQGGRYAYPPCPGLGPDGGMAEYMRVKARYLEPLGDLDPVQAAPLADAGLTPMHAINGARHRLGPGSTAVVIAVGGLGHVGLQILAATTSARIIAVDSSEQKLEIAQEHGADLVLKSDENAVKRILEETGGYGADAVFDFVGVQPTIDLATHTIAPDGALRVVGLGGGSFTYEANGTADPLPWGVDVRRSFGGTRTDQRQVLSLAQQGKISVDVQTYPLADGLKAFADLEAGTVRGRAVLVP